MTNLPALPRRYAALLTAMAAVLIQSLFNLPVSATELACRHPVSIVEADILVQPKRIALRVKCFADELELIQGLQPQPDGVFDPVQLQAATDRHCQFLLERIELLDAAGERLSPRITRTVYVQVPAAGLRPGELMEHGIGFEAELDLSAAPGFLTLVQRLSGEQYLFPGELKVLLRQDGTELVYEQTMEPDSPETFRFDWSNAAPGQDSSDEDWQAWFERRRTETLGISSYSSVYSFVYIERQVTRHEILIPLANFLTMIPFQRAQPGFLEKEEQVLAAEQIRQFFSVGNEVRINGETVSPVIERVDFYGLDLRDFATRPGPKRISVANGRVGLIIEYPCLQPPQTVALEWDLFNEAIRSVDTVVFAAGRTESTQFSSYIDSNIFEWKAQPGDWPPIALAATTTSAPRSLPPLQLPLLGTLLGLGGIALLIRQLPGIRKKSELPPRRLASSLWPGSLLAGAWIAWPYGHLPIGDSRGFEPIQAEQAAAVFSSLHDNLFRAFDFRDEGAIYDSLALSVDGPLLEELYLKVRASLRVQEQGGTMAQIDRVDRISGELSNSPHSQRGQPCFDYRCQWALTGTIGHWGHLHQRKNQYDAQFRVSWFPEGWKITAMETLDERPGELTTRLQKF